MPASNLLKDPLFQLGIAAAPICWTGLFFILQPSIRWDWPLLHPLVFLMPVMIYPVLEEIVFRGLIQELVHEFISKLTVGPISIANVLTSLLFAGLHLVSHPPLWAALVFFPSLVFGFFKERTGGLLAPIILHVFYNAGFLWLFSTHG